MTIQIILRYWAALSCNQHPSLFLNRRSTEFLEAFQCRFYGVIFQNNGVNTGNFSEIVGIGGNEQENGQMLFISTQEQTS